MLARLLLRLGVSLLPLLALFSCLGVRSSTDSPKKTAELPKGRAMEGMAGRYGFRVDPVQFAAADRGLQGALVRTFVLGRPLPADQVVPDKRIAEVLKEQRPDGSFGRGPAGDASETNNQVLELLDLGVSPDRPELKRAVEWALGRPRADPEIANHLYFTQALCQMGQGSLPRVRASLRWLADHPEEWIAKGCPWTPAMAVKTLSAGREIEKSDAAIARGLTWIADNLNDAGCLSYWEPFGLLDCAGRVDHPQGRRIVERQLPMILRAQRPDGGWGDKSFVVFRALVRYGLLDPLRKLPPLPPDWRVVRSIPAPEGEPGSMVWEGQRLWVHDRKGNLALAVSPEDGRVLKTIKLPDGETCGIGAWDGALAAVQRKPKRVLQLDPETGAVRKEIVIEKMAAPVAIAQVNGKLWVSDGWLFPGCVIDPANPTVEEPGPGAGRLERRLAGPLPLSFAPTGDGVWHVEFWAPILIQSGPEGKLLDWGEKPFGGAVGGIAWDGKQLWAIDLAQKRICVIEKAAPAPKRRATGRAAGSAGAAKGGTVRREDGKVWIEGMDRYRVIDPVFEGIRLILAQRGESYSSEYIQGISGSAFRIGGICPCAPTCDNAMSPQDLIRLLGYEFEHVKIGGKGEELAAATRAAVARVKQEIDAGRAALVWHAFTNAEWDVVYGYDREKKQFLGRGSYAGNDKPFAEADEMRMGTCGGICDPLGVILIGRKAGQLDAPKAELDALQEAVRHARSQKNVDKLGGEKWVMLQGIACYDRWAREFRDDPKRKRGVGDAYCYGVYRSTHRAAAGLLREIAPKYPKGAEHLRQAAGQFEAEANVLDKGEKLLWWNSPEGPDAKRNAEAAALLKQVRDAYAAGITAIEQALAATPR